VAGVPAALLLLAGCGDGRPTRVPVKGRVLIDGKPLETGNIRFHSTEHRAASAKINADGSFTLSTYDFGDGVVTGEHLVSVNGSKLLNPRTLRWLAPKKYASAATSELVYEIAGPTDNAEIQLTWNGGKPFNEQILGGGD
jgi:hypothetical protein